MIINTFVASLYSLMESGIQSVVSTDLLGTNNDSLLILPNGLLQSTASDSGGNENL